MGYYTAHPTVAIALMPIKFNTPKFISCILDSSVFSGVLLKTLLAKNNSILYYNACSSVWLLIKLMNEITRQQHCNVLCNDVVDLEQFID